MMASTVERTSTGVCEDGVSSTGSFPMFTLPSSAFMKMSRVQPHEDLMEAGDLCIFHESLGRAMFVSHQWVTSKHPDPNFEQLQVLQETLKNMLSGAYPVSLPPAIEIFWGRVKCPTAADFKSEVYLWYDYFSIPQHESERVHREHAIQSIPSYISKCFFFVILCPLIHLGRNRNLNFSTWAERGWCRLERMARDLTREDGFVIAVQVASSPTLAPYLCGLGAAPGGGSFGVEADRRAIGRVLCRMVWSKLHTFLLQGDFHQYRFLLNLQRHSFEGVDIEPMDCFVPGFSTEIDPSTDPQGFVVERFLHDNGFKSIHERDIAGWTPLCYAVLRDDPFLVESLLEQNANPNEVTTKAKKDAQLPKGIPVLFIAGVYHSNKVIKSLLHARADVHARDCLGGGALTGVLATANKEAIKLLCEAKIDPNVKIFPGISPFKLACGCGYVPCIQEMMRCFPSVSMRFALHFALAFYGEAPEVSYLIEASADINEQFRVNPRQHPIPWALLKGLGLKHRLSPSALTYLSYHHHGATPLMFSLMAGKFESTLVLLKAGASLELRNSRGKTAQDILEETKAPISLAQEVLSDCDSEDTVCI